MREWFLLLACALLALPASAATPGAHDPEFEKYPVAKWLADSRQSHFRWRVEMPAPELSTHQRLMLRVTARIDGREAAKRGNEDIVTLLQIQDAAGRLWQNHAALNLPAIPQNAQLNDFTITHFAFVLPGDYTVTVAICDAGTLEHSLIVRKLHVAPLRTDPLPDAWAGFPAIEFISPRHAAPDVWYLPEIRERLHVSTPRPRHPVRIQILVNTTPSERASASIGALKRNMSVAIPALKILSQLDVPDSTIGAALLDLTHRRVPFEQNDVQLLDWERMRNYFLDLKPGLIDVSSLQGHWKMRRFFWEEVTRRLQPKGDAIPIVIVLSGPAFFENQEPAEIAPVEAESERRLFYIRYRTPTARPQRVRVRPGMRPPTPAPALDPLPLDDLEHTLEPLGARIFDATSAEQFRRVLAAIVEQISRI